MKAAFKFFAVFICTLCIQGCACIKHTPKSENFPDAMVSTEPLTNDAFSAAGCMVLQRLSTKDYEIIIAAKEPKDDSKKKFLAVYLKSGPDSYRLFFQSETPQLLRQNLTIKESPAGNFRNFKRAEVEGGVLNIYFEHLTIEAPFSNEDEYFRYLEERVWKSLDLPDLQNKKPSGE